MELIPSAAPRLCSVVESVNQALNAASLAVEPKKVITQSINMTRLIPIDAAPAAAVPRKDMIISFRIRANPRIESPHAIYPAHMRILRLPILSEKAPITMVVTAAVTALACTIREICEADAWNIL